MKLQLSIIIPRHIWSNSGFIFNLQTTHRKVTTKTENEKQHYT
jgi:hypothetical protein